MYGAHQQDVLQHAWDGSQPEMAVDAAGCVTNQ
jgi:hypothetical protein